MLEEIFTLVHLVKSYRQLAIDERVYPSLQDDPYCYFNRRIRELDHQAERIGIPGIIPEKGACNRTE